MKLSTRSRFSQSSGFTLVELLVVIAIIAILASVLAVSAGAVIKSANRAKVNANASQIQTAALNYYTEYGVYPAPSDQPAGTDFVLGDASTNEKDWSDLIDGLSGGVSPSSGKTVTTSTVNNTRGIAFLTMKNSDVVGGSSTTTADAPKNLVAPSGGTSVTYNIAVDYDYDGVLGITPSKATMPNFATSTSTSLSQTGGSSSAGVAIWVNTTGYTTGSTNALNGNLWVKTY
jgi:prepilin-type N-terminal cleavage/methylation domain-containing protein